MQRKIRADTLEAIVGAKFLDQGIVSSSSLCGQVSQVGLGYAEAQRFVTSELLPHLRDFDSKQPVHARET